MECARQRSGELSVAWLLDAWAYAAHRLRADPTYADLMEIGRLVEPKVNRYGTRRGDVRIEGRKKVSPALIERDLRNLVLAWRALSADEWLLEFDDIQPFEDGNVRVGGVLWNWRHNTLPSPLPTPPPLRQDPVDLAVRRNRRLQR